MLTIFYPSSLPAKIISIVKLNFFYISEGKIFLIIDDSNPCPPSTICVNDTTTPNPAFISWTHQN